MEKKIAQLAQQKSAIVNFAVNTNKTAKANQTKGWSKCYDLFNALVNEGAASCTQQEYDVCETAYAESMGTLNDLLVSPQKMPFNSAHTLALPHINLPTFECNYLHWYAFKDRLQYLKDSLTGDAKHTLDNITTTDGNFLVAWTLVEGKYENKRVIIHAHISDIMNLPTAQKESASALRQLSDGVTPALRALEHLGRDTKYWEDWLVYIMVHKLDSASRKAWEMSLPLTCEIPTFDSFKTFLDNRVSFIGKIITTQQKLFEQER